MTKSICSLLLLFVGFSGLAQPLDSVLIDNEWRYVYPVNERIDFDYHYYAKLGLTAEEFPVWIQWKATNDPRANFKSKDLKQAIQLERYKRKEVYDSVYDRKIHHDSWRGGFQEIYSEKDYRRNFRLLYDIECDALDFIPPVVRNLPDGKYVQFFEAYVTYDKLSKCQLVEHQIAAKFELLNNELDHQFERFSPDKTLLASGVFDNGLKTGKWFETTKYDSEAFKYKRQLDFWNETSISDYVSGVKNGKCYMYFNERLSNIYNYSNGKPFGVAVDITGQDSIVYDVFTTSDQRVNYRSLERVYGSGSYYSGPHNGKKNMASAYYLDRVIPNLFASSTIGQEINIKHYPDSIGQNFFAGTYRTYPLFETHYTIYDRKTKKIIFRCFLDTVTKLYSGSSWFPNGQKFDSIWTNPETMSLERIFCDTNGMVVFSTLNGDGYDTGKMIDGYHVRSVNDSKGKPKYYYYEANDFGSDTIYRKMRWDLEEKRISTEYRLVSDSSHYSIVYHGDDFCSAEINRNRKLITYKENGIELKAYIPLKDGGEPMVSIFANGQPYEGPIEFRSGKHDEKIQLKRGKLVLNYVVNNNSDNVENGSIAYGQSDSKYSSLKLMRLILLNFEDFELSYKTVDGTFRNNRLEGNTVIEEGWSHKKMELNYTNGLPNGKIMVYKKRNKHYDELDRHNDVDSLCHFSEKRFHKVYLYKSYTFKNGLLDGALVHYTTGGDTTGVIPFENGVKNGKVFQYRPYTKMNAEFRNDTLVHKLEVFSLNRSSGYDTLWYVSFDNHGNFTNGLYKTKSYRSQLAAYVYVREHYKRMENGIIDCKSSENNVVFEHELIDQFRVIQRDVVESGEVRFTEEFTDMKKPRSYFGPFSVMNGVDDYDKGIIWNRESDKKHDFNPPVMIYNTEYSSDKYPRYIKKYFSNGIILREGAYLVEGRYGDSKNGVWKVNDYNGRKLYEINYHDSVMKIGSLYWKTIGIQTEFDSLGNVVSTRAVLSEKETYECSSDDYYAERQYITLSSEIPSRMNGLTKNYYDNGALMNEGKVINGVPEGLWKFYTPDGKLTRLGSYQNGLENGKWLFGDLGEKAYIGEVCIDPNDPEYEFTMHQLEIDKEVEVVVYKNGVELGSSNYSTVRNSRSSRNRIVEPDF